MWRSYVICVLIGLLLVSTGANILLLRQNLAQQTEADQLRARLTAAQTQANRAAAVTVATAAPAGGAGPVGSAPATSAAATPATATSASATPGAVGAPVPGPGASVSSPDHAELGAIEDQVAGLRGLAPQREVPVKQLDQAALQQFLVNRFNADYLPNERESSQKLLATLGMIAPTDSVVQTLLGVLQEQVIGVYNEDDQVMYLVSDRAQFGPVEKATFAHEFTHALQDQYYDLRTLSPKHPANDDRALAIQALVEGDATLLQRLWAQSNLNSDELNQLTQGGGDSRLFQAPLFLRQELLFPYTDGFGFVRQLYQSGGYAAIDAVYHDPPQSTEQILHPEKYRAHEPPAEVSLADLSGTLGAGWRQISTNVFGELQLRLILQQLNDQARGVRGASGWGGDRWELLEQDGRQAVVLKTVWDTPNDAREFFDTLSAGLKNRYPSARAEEASATRQALTTDSAATDVRRDGQNVLVVLSFDRPSADALIAAATSR
jgi:hypothetical protein